MKKYVIGFKLPGGRVEVDEGFGDSGTLKEMGEYMRTHYRLFANARIYKLVEVRSPSPSSGRKI